MNIKTKRAVKEIVTNLILDEIISIFNWDYHNYLDDSQTLKELYKSEGITTLRGTNNRVIAVFKPSKLIELYIRYLTNVLNLDTLNEPLYDNILCTITELRVLISGGNVNGFNKRT